MKVRAKIGTVAIVLVLSCVLVFQGVIIMLKRVRRLGGVSASLAMFIQVEKKTAQEPAEWNN
jgi:hypothetical protein